LPGSCSSRIKRNDASGRVHEIQRLVGRSLRAVVEMNQIGENTIKIDCDVIQADGGTRTASITGGFVALVLALDKMKKQKIIQRIPIKDYVAAVSVGIVENTLLLDLKYDEDSNAQMDMNVVMLGKEQFVEVQGTAEKGSFSKKQMDGLLDLAQKGVEQLMTIQKGILKGIKF
ncbi:MAG TPA: ribonuclease PH, partial [Candidatus Omnitrophota bacterium]|nr:ribonuclease PH [Candidatus Omnitrophota bacterium]